MQKWSHSSCQAPAETPGPSARLSDAAEGGAAAQEAEWKKLREDLSPEEFAAVRTQSKEVDALLKTLNDGFKRDFDNLVKKIAEPLTKLMIESRFYRRHPLLETTGALLRD